MPPSRKKLALGVMGLLGVALLERMLRGRRSPSACLYGQRFSLEFPRPFLTHTRLREMLIPEPGERVLEVGPGTGYYGLHVARWLEPDSTLDVLDLQQRMVDYTMRRARDLGISNIAPVRGDAASLPYPDDSFDAAYLVATLGEVPDQESALSELSRVLRPEGRLVVGEGLPDPHMVSFGTLRERAKTAGVCFEHRTGGSFGDFASFRSPWRKA